MPLTPTVENEIDRKLRRILVEAGSGAYESIAKLSVHIEKQEFSEFSYQRDEKTHYSSWKTVRKYVVYAQALGLLREDLGPAKPRSLYDPLETFQNWLSDKVIAYLESKKASVQDINRAVAALLAELTPRLPTPDNVHEELGRPLSKEPFKFSLKVISLLRPNILKLRSRQLVFSSKTLRE